MNVPHVFNGLNSVEVTYGYDHSGIVTVEARLTSNDEVLPMTVTALSDDWIKELGWGGRTYLRQLQLLCTPRGESNIETILKTMKLAFKPYQTGRASLGCDVLFWNCQTFVNPDPAAVREYVEQGGCLYFSCCAADTLAAVFSDVITFEAVSCQKGTVELEVTDSDLAFITGATLKTSHLAETCRKFASATANVQTLLREKKTGRDVAVCIPCGEGFLFYNSLHNPIKVKSTEQFLLQSLIMKLFSVISDSPISLIQKTLKVMK